MNRTVFHQIFRLFRRQNNVFVVGEDENIARVDLLRRRSDVARGGVHRLPAFDDFIYAEIFEDARKPFARADGKHAHIFLFRLAFGAQLTVLFQHVFDLRTIELAQLQRVRERHARLICMHVHFHKL